MILLRVISLACFAALSLGMAGAAPTEAELKARLIADAIGSGKVAELEVFFLPYKYSTITRITPKTIEKQAMYRCRVTLDQASKSELQRLFQRLKASGSGKDRPVYWGVFFDDVDGNRLFSLYLDKRYSNWDYANGWLDGIQSQMDLTILDWLEPRFTEERLAENHCTRSY